MSEERADVLERLFALTEKVTLIGANLAQQTECRAKDQGELRATIEGLQAAVSALQKDLESFRSLLKLVGAITRLARASWPFLLAVGTAVAAWASQHLPLGIWGGAGG